jgi:hypothetical protein
VWWLPVLEVAHVLSAGETTQEPEHGCHTVHNGAHGLALTSLGVGIPADMVGEDDTYKLVLPPSRWPPGGRTKASQGNGRGRGRGGETRFPS